MEKRLYRSKDNRMIAGVAGGIAEYLNIDPVIVRIIFVVLAIGHGAGLVAYLIGWLIIPENPTQVSPKEKDLGAELEKNAKRVAEEVKATFPQAETAKSGRKLSGLLLIILGLIFLLQNFVPIISFIAFWPVILIILGLWLVTKSLKNKE